MKVSKVLVAAVVTAIAAGAAGAQSTVNCGGSGELVIGATVGASTCLVSNTVSAVVPSVARLAITTSSTTLTAPLAADFGTAGSGNLVTSAGPTLNVSANVGHTLTASSPTNWSVTGQVGTPSGPKPAADLEIKVGAGSFAAIGILGSATAAATNNVSYPLTFGTKYNWTVDVPGTYSLALTFTLTSP